MAESFIQLPADSTGKKLRTREETISAQLVHTQYVAQAAAPSYIAWSGAQVFAQNKHFLSVFNVAASGKLVRIRKVFLINLQTAAVTGAVALFDFKRTTAQSAGTAVTMSSMDTSDAVPAQGVVAVAVGATITEGATLFLHATGTDEVTALNTAAAHIMQAGLNLIPEGSEIKELHLRPGEGFTVKQTAAVTTGSYGVMIVLTVE